jgi:poly-gamma-glutamate synthesis protein (capsule biosynthesis protein)
MHDKHTVMRNGRLLHVLAGLCICVVSVQVAFGEDAMRADPIILFMCGDVMTGRGIDQILPHPSKPQIYESYVKNAKGYVELAERVNGPIEHPVEYSYIWGDALDELKRVSPDVRIINLETSITTSEDYWKNKGINYRMNPKNIPCITAAGIDCCVLANNHVLDWGYAGLADTLESLRSVNVQSAGAGRNLQQAEAPVIMNVEGRGRVVLFSFGSASSGVARDWSATKERPGVNRLNDLSDETVRLIKENVAAVEQPGDIVIASIHWGGNWGYEIPAEHRIFALQLIDEAGVDVIHGHSSHHIKGIEVYKDKLILYGCGDFLNDYEGIGGFEAYRSDLALMYFASLDPATGKLVELRLTPMQIRHFSLNRVSKSDALWIVDTLSREGGALGTRAEPNEDRSLNLVWE